MSRDLKIITFALFLWGCGEGLFFYIMPLYMQQLGATPPEVGAVLGLAAFLAACSFIPGGLLADRFDAKKVMIWGWAIGAVASLGMGLATTWQWFVPWILIYNVSAYCIPAINTYVVEASGDLPLEHTITVTFAGYAAGSIISPFIGGRLSATLGTAPLFIIGAIIFGLSFLLVLSVNSHAPHLNYAKQRDHSLRQQLTRLRPLTLTYLRLFFVFFAAIIGTILPANFLATLRWKIDEVNSLAGTAARHRRVSASRWRWAASPPGRRGVDCYWSGSDVHVDGPLHQQYPCSARAVSHRLLLVGRLADAARIVQRPAGRTGRSRYARHSAGPERNDLRAGPQPCRTAGRVIVCA
jgi:MFS family permease